MVAALLSALVFPGVGQWYQRRRGRALLFLGPAAVAGLAYLNYAMSEANAVVDQVLGGSGAIDPAAIAARLEAQATPTWVTVAGVVFVVCWVGSIAEALAAPRT
jgi:hypothetical protein